MQSTIGDAAKGCLRCSPKDKSLVAKHDWIPPPFEDRLSISGFGEPAVQTVTKA
jgi:hypothetical protein